MKKHVPYGVWNSILFCAVMFFDRITKYAALKGDFSHYSIPFVSCNVTINRGVSWGLFHSESFGQFFFITCIIAFTIIILVYQLYTRLKQHSVIWPYVIVIAGALSNFIDRLMYHGVIDFIEVSCSDWAFPIFNVADVVIVLGVSYIIVQELRE